MSTIRNFLRFAPLLVALALAGTALRARAGDDAHHHHHQHIAAAGYERQVAQYRLPAIELVRADGTKASFPQELDDGRPVVLNFIYTSCTAICPILSQSFAEFQRRLGAEREQVRMVSISIDPEEDTPRRLSEYAQRFDAGRQWGFYTGSNAASVSLQKAFQAYYGGKMHHRPVTFLRPAPGQPWVRLDGFTSPDELLAEYRRLAPRH
ncbi:SCO family protein [Ramlibacter monticola]|uniref:SCO family protein n=1 Tax=Ramlibacter monticola TaxID=1926872 RepID=A0A936YXR2_9BURK|nr:SCO family protein [Ramlibacter monticola]MBL0390823.1 SCO family protein [Ramlibacter monticola]